MWRFGIPSHPRTDSAGVKPQKLTSAEGSVMVGCETCRQLWVYNPLSSIGSSGANHTTIPLQIWQRGDLRDQLVVCRGQRSQLGGRDLGAPKVCPESARLGRHSVKPNHSACVMYSVPARIDNAYCDGLVALNKPQLLCNDPGNETPEHISNHDPANSPIGLLQCRQSSHSECFQNLVENPGTSEELSNLKQQLAIAHLSIKRPNSQNTPRTRRQQSRLPALLQLAIVHHQIALTVHHRRSCAQN